MKQTQNPFETTDINPLQSLNHNHIRQKDIVQTKNMRIMEKKLFILLMKLKCKKRSQNRIEKITRRHRSIKIREKIEIIITSRYL